MPIDTSPEGAELLHQPVVKPFPETSPKHPHHAHPAQQAGDDGHNHDLDSVLQGVTGGAAREPALIQPPPGH